MTDTAPGSSVYLLPLPPPPSRGGVGCAAFFARGEFEFWARRTLGGRGLAIRNVGTSVAVRLGFGTRCVRRIKSLRPPVAAGMKRPTAPSQRGDFLPYLSYCGEWSFHFAMVHVCIPRQGWCCVLSDFELWNWNAGWFVLGVTGKTWWGIHIPVT